MNAKVVDGKALAYVLIRPDGFVPDASYPLVVFLHGFGASRFDLASLAPELDAEGYFYAFANTPNRVDLGYGASSNRWGLNHPGIELPPRDPRPIEELLDVFLAQVTEQAKNGLPRSDTFAGLVAMSASFQAQEELHGQLPAARRPPIFVSHGDHDPMICIEHAPETMAFLEDAGYAPLYHEYEMAHEIRPKVLADLTPRLHAVAPPRAASRQAVEG